jgi:flagellar hook-length control protein FliK
LIPKEDEEKGLQISNEGHRDRISEDFMRVVIQTSRNENHARISLTDVIGGLEQLAGGTKKERQFPPQVQALIDKILERAVVSESKEKPIPPFSCSSRFQQISQIPKDTLHREVKFLEGERPSPLLGEKCIGQPTSKVPSGLDIYEGFKKLGREDEEVIKWDTRIRDIVGNPRHSTLSVLNNPSIQNRDSIVNTLPAYLIDQVGKWVSRSMLRGERVIRLQLRPPELGAMKVEMDMKGNVLKLGITTENGVVKELLLTNVHELRETLVEQGIKLGKIDVQINHHFDESLENSEERFREGQRWVHELNREPSTKDKSMEDSIVRSLAMAAGTYLLNLIA